MRVGVHIGIHPQRNRALHAVARGQRVDQRQLRLRTRN